MHRLLRCFPAASRANYNLRLPHALQFLYLGRETGQIARLRAVLGDRTTPADPCRHSRPSPAPRLPSCARKRVAFQGRVFGKHRHQTAAGPAGAFGAGYAGEPASSSTVGTTSITCPASRATRRARCPSTNAPQRRARRLRAPKSCMRSSVLLAVDQPAPRHRYVKAEPSGSFGHARHHAPSPPHSHRCRT